MGQLVTADPHAGAGRDAACAASRGGTKTTPPPLMGGLLRAGPLEHLHACSLLAAATYGPCCAPASFPCSSAAPCSALACRRSYTRPVASPLRAAAALVGLRAATASPACAVPATLAILRATRSLAPCAPPLLLPASTPQLPLALRGCAADPGWSRTRRSPRSAPLATRARE